MSSRDYRLGQLCNTLGILPLDLAALLVRHDLAMCTPTESLELQAYEERIAAAYRDRDYCAREADKAQRRAEAAEAQLAAVREALESFAQDVAAARRNREPPRGMQVPYHGPFCSAVPSVIRDLERQVMAFERALDEAGC